MQKNCYFGCELDGPLHRFPSLLNEDRFTKWKSILGDDLKYRDDAFIHGNVRLCARHFEHKYHTRGKRLTANSVPTLNLLTPRSVHEAESQIWPPTVQATSSNATFNISPPVGVQITSCASVPQNRREIIEKKHKVLTSEIRKYLKVASLLKLKLLKAQEKCKSVTQRLKKPKAYIKAIEKLPEPSYLFAKMQRQFNKKPKGRRFSIQEKILALTIYKQSQKAYHLMRSLFVLPSKRCLQKVLSLIPLKPGINDFIFENLKKTVQKLPAEKKLCTLLFDEVAITPGLYYAKHNDEIVGFEDFGDQKSTKIADHALVFMVKGMKGKYKQPIVFTFCQSSTKRDELKCQLKEVIRQVRKTGLIIVATICDQGGPNMSVINTLIGETKQKYLRLGQEYKSMAFEVDDEKIYPLFDPPHLLKGVRNNLIDKKLRYIQDGQVKFANWEHLKMLLAIDVGDILFNKSG